ncbi:hypothetical protein EKN06_12815 [Croceicoccus ponticola]|uniref:Uncharacterized protein n=1 Tax=Croceicoccus ponticola TaxID=2217664 RepID=A0A437GVK5_9SPHN|nr:hypothetical protein [Croceicoccus ponticola]RVQ65802.1 hypothetical protein EKN06_12815 [Croceicoccus ponticola]
MADKQIDELPGAGPLDGNESVHVVQAAQSRKTTTDDIAEILHDQAIEDVAGLQAALDGKARAGDVLGAASTSEVRAGATAAKAVTPAALHGA